MDEVSQRRERRLAEVNKFVAAASVTVQQLAASTQKCLDDWAREILVIRDQPSANAATAVLHLCKAIESELANTPGKKPGLEFLADEEPLGDKVRRPRHLDHQTKQRLDAISVKTGLLRDLEGLLSRLAKIRRETKAAHGGLQIETTTSADAKQARETAATILRRLHTPRR